MVRLHCFHIQGKNTTSFTTNTWAIVIVNHTLQLLKQCHMGEVTKRMGSRLRKIVRSYNGIFLFLMVLLFFIYSFFFQYLVIRRIHSENFKFFKVRI